MSLQEIERLLQETQQSVETVAELAGMSVHQVVNAVCAPSAVNPLSGWFEVFQFLPAVIELTALDDKDPKRFKVHGWDLFHAKKKRIAFFLPADDYSKLSCTPELVLGILKQVNTIEQAERDNHRSSEKINNLLNEVEKLRLESEERLKLAHQIAGLEI